MSNNFSCSLTFFSCQNSYLQFSSPCVGNQVRRFCGSSAKTIIYEVEPCANTLIMQYVTASNTNQNYRGFNLFYEGWSNLRLKLLFICFNPLFFKVSSKDVISDEISENICSGDSKTITCEKSAYSNYTIVINQALQGVKKSPENQCLLT